MVSNVKKNPGRGFKFPPWKDTMQLVTRMNSRGVTIVDYLARVPEFKPRYIRNGDLGLHPETEINLSYTVLVTALNILRFSRVSDTKDAPSRFTQDLTVTEKGWYFGFHADDWFRAFLAICYFLERRRHRLDVERGLFKERDLYIYRVAKTEPSTSPEEDPVIGKDLIATVSRFFEERGIARPRRLDERVGDLLAQLFEDSRCHSDGSLSQVSSTHSEERAVSRDPTEDGAVVDDSGNAVVDDGLMGPADGPLAKKRKNNEGCALPASIVPDSQASFQSPWEMEEIW